MGDLTTDANWDLRLFFYCLKFEFILLHILNSCVPQMSLAAKLVCFREALKKKINFELEPISPSEAVYSQSQNVNKNAKEITRM